MTHERRWPITVEAASREWGTAESTEGNAAGGWKRREGMDGWMDGWMDRVPGSYPITVANHPGPAPIGSRGALNGETSGYFPKRFEVEINTPYSPLGHCHCPIPPATPATLDGRPHLGRGWVSRGLVLSALCFCFCFCCSPYFPPHPAPL